MEISNYDAGLQVEKFGTGIVFPEEVDMDMRTAAGDGLGRRLDFYQGKGMEMKKW